jgi:hypothetical protein
MLAAYSLCIVLAIHHSYSQVAKTPSLLPWHRYGEDALSAETLSQLRLKPMATLLYIFHTAEELLEAVGPRQLAAAGQQAERTGKQLAAEQVGVGKPLLLLENPILLLAALPLLGPLADVQKNACLCQLLLLRERKR